VTSIRGKLEAALVDGRDDKWPEAVAEAIEGLDRLSQQLNTTLDLAEAEGGALKLERAPIDLSQAVRQLVDLYRPAMADRHHRLVVDLQDHVYVDADANLMNRTISNLLENEMVHVPAGCEVHVRVKASDGSAEFVVQDNGPGFPPDIGSRAFERFVKGEHSPGHGLGLAFVDAIVQAHGGTVKISGGEIGGAVIAISLPLAVLEPAWL
jgi:signal transduction histidine kinase